jgi:glucokinase
VSSTAIGVDVGGTKVALGLVAPDGTLRSRGRIENREAGGSDELLALVADRCRELTADGEAAALGVALCEVIDLDGEVRSNISITWTRRQILDALSSIAPVSIEADVRAAALAEAHVGAGRDRRSVGYVSVGTGVSASLVLEGVPYEGAHGAAQLLGSAELSLDCPHCGTPIRAAALEDVAAGPVLVARYNDEVGATVASGEELFALAAGGDAVAERIVRRGGEILGAYVALFVNIVDPEIVVLGGGLGAAGGAYRDTVERSARDHIWARHVRDVSIVPAELGAHAGVVGAGLTALRAIGSLG